ncbi:MAG: autotransporter outer membrane beta-barrel domain-containing protein [Gammaproteobacteria bacterium]|nr:autotransporter outer membrane beta-barrel domain-containing protein [Gammaproteobacteria bacterium]
MSYNPGKDEINSRHQNLIRISPKKLKMLKINTKNLKLICLSALTLLFALNDVMAANTFNKLQGRDSHQNIESGLILQTTNAANNNLELNSQVKFNVQLMLNDSPVPAANIDWEIIHSVTTSNGQTAYFVTAASQFSILETVPSDINGNSSIFINTGEIASVYRITATASVYLNSDQLITLTQTFLVNAGVRASIKNNTPENEIASTLDNLCPKLEENKNQLTKAQEALLNRCNAIQQAVSEGKTVEVSKALRQMSPEEVAVQADVGSSFSNQQMSNVASRLNAVRRGSSKLSFNNLGFRYRGRAIPVNYMLTSLLADEGNKVTNEPGGLLSNRLGVFANGSASAGNRAATSKEDGFKFDSYGLTLGADYRVSSTRFVGAALGVSKSDVQISEQGGEMNAAGLSLNVYLNQYLADQWYIDGVINIGNNTFDMQRNINFDLSGNAVNRVANSNTRGLQQGLSISSGYEVYDGALSASFSGSLNYTKLGIDGFTENGAQELDLIINKQSIDSTSSTIGAQVQYTHSHRLGVFIPFVGLSWIHEFNDSPDTISGAFANDQFNSAFNIKTEKVDSNYFSNVQGITAILPRGISAYIRMENIIGRDYYKTTNVSFGGRMELQF